MVMEFVVVHVKPDKTESIIATIDNPEKVMELIEVAKYAGAWLTDTRKVLRFNKGEIQVRRQMKGLVIEPGKELVFKGTTTVWMECKVTNGDFLHSVCFNESMFIGYTVQNMPLWTAHTFTELVDKVGKGAAWALQQEYDRYVSRYELKGAM